MLGRIGYALTCCPSQICTKTFLSCLLYSREHIADYPFMEILKICVNAQTKGSKYLTQLMSTGDIIQEDLENRKQLVFNRARGNE